MEFEWDDAKNIANVTKHGVDFDTATGVFADPWAVEVLDDREDYGEDRYVTIGMVDNRLLTVVYAIRGEKHRIISARGATIHEQRRYHEEN